MAKDETELNAEDSTEQVAWSSEDSADSRRHANGDEATTHDERRTRTGRRKRASASPPRPGGDAGDGAPDTAAEGASSSTSAKPSTYASIGDYGVSGTSGGPSESPTSQAVDADERLWRPTGQPFQSLGHSARYHWHLVAACALIGVLLGAAFGFVKAPNYTAETRLFVGKTTQLSNLASVPGLDAAGQSLAASYSRLATTDQVLRATAKALGGTMDGTLSASPIPQSPIVRLEGTSTTSAGALAIAKAGSKALVNAVNKLNEDQSKSADAILKKYEEADLELVAAQAQLDSLKGQLTRAQAAGSAQSVLSGLQDQVNAAQTVVDGNQVKVTALANTYGDVFNPTAINTQVLQIVGDPQATGSDRKSTLQLGLLGGLVGGCVVGLGIAVLIDLRARRRA